MKVQATSFKGIEYVSFHELPVNQQLLLQHHTGLERIQLLIDGRIFRNCIQYKDYSNWYTSVFLQSVPVQTQNSKPIEVALPASSPSETVVEV